MALVGISALPATTVISAADLVPFVRGGVTDKVTAGNLRTSLFGFAQTDPLSIGALTVVGNSTITGTLGGVTAFSAQSGSFSTTLAVTGASTLGNYLTATGLRATSTDTPTTGVGVELLWTGTFGLVQSYDRNGAGPQPTRISGTYVEFNVPGTGVTSSTDATGFHVAIGAITMATAVSQIVPGATSLSLRNNANTLNNILVSDAGLVTLRNSLVFSQAVGKIVPGATSLSLRNNADGADNLIITDAGIITTRGAVAGAAGQVGGVHLPIGVGLRATNNAGTNSLHLIGSVGGTDRVTISADGTDISWGVPLIALGGGAGATLGTIGGTGPTGAAQNKWLRMLDSAGAAMWIPIWR